MLMGPCKLLPAAAYVLLAVFLTTSLISQASAKESHDQSDLVRNRDHINEILLKNLPEDETETRKKIEKEAKVLHELREIYQEQIRPIERQFHYADLKRHIMTDADITAKPIVLLVGPWSSGKSTIINYFLGLEDSMEELYVGAEPTTADFTVLTYGDEYRTAEGIVLATDPTKPFSSMEKFGQIFLEHLLGIEIPSRILKNVTFIDTPGILENRRQQERGYPYNAVLRWLVMRADLIFVVFDPTKLDVGTELESLFKVLKGKESALRIILNKADSMGQQELMRVYGALFWSLSPLINVTEPPRVYVGSFWNRPYRTLELATLLRREEKSLLLDMREIIRNQVHNKIAFMRQHAIRVRIHALLVDSYVAAYRRNKGIFDGADELAKHIVKNPADYNVYKTILAHPNVSEYDLPDPDEYTEFYQINPLSDLKRVAEICSWTGSNCPFEKMNLAIGITLPSMLRTYQAEIGEQTCSWRGGYCFPTPDVPAFGSFVEELEEKKVELKGPAKWRKQKIGKQLKTPEPAPSPPAPKKPAPEKVQLKAQATAKKTKPQKTIVKKAAAPKVVAEATDFHATGFEKESKGFDEPEIVAKEVEEPDVTGFEHPVNTGYEEEIEQPDPDKEEVPVETTEDSEDKTEEGSEAGDDDESEDPDAIEEPSESAPSLEKSEQPDDESDEDQTEPSTDAAEAEDESAEKPSGTTAEDDDDDDDEQEDAAADPDDASEDTDVDTDETKEEDDASEEEEEEDESKKEVDSEEEEQAGEEEESEEAVAAASDEEEDADEEEDEEPAATDADEQDDEDTEDDEVTEDEDDDDEDEDSPQESHEGDESVSEQEEGDDTSAEESDDEDFKVELEDKVECRYRTSCYKTGVVPDLVELAAISAQALAAPPRASEGDGDDTEELSELGRKVFCRYRQSCYESGDRPDLSELAPPPVIQYADSEDDDEDLDEHKRQQKIKIGCKFRSSCYESGVVPDISELAAASASALASSAGEDGGEVDLTAVSELQKKVLCRYRTSCYESGIIPGSSAAADATSDQSGESDEDDDDDEDDQTEAAESKPKAEAHIQLECKYRTSCYETGEAPDIAALKAQAAEAVTRPSVSAASDDELSAHQEELKKKLDCRYRTSCYESGDVPDLLELKKLAAEAVATASTVQSVTEHREQDPRVLCRYRKSCYESGEVPDLAALKREAAKAAASYVRPQEDDEDEDNSEKNMKVRCKYRKNCYETGEQPDIDELVSIAKEAAKAASDAGDDEEEDQSAKSLKLQCKFRKNCYESGDLPDIDELKTKAGQNMETEDDSDSAEDESEETSNLEDHKLKLQQSLECKYRKSCYETGEAPDLDQLALQAAEALAIKSVRAEVEDDEEDDEHKAALKQKLRCRYRKNCYETGEQPDLKALEMQAQEALINRVETVESDEDLDERMREYKTHLRCKYRTSCYESGDLPNIAELKKLAAEAQGAAVAEEDAKDSEDQEYDGPNAEKVKCRYRSSCYETGEVPNLAALKAQANEAASTAPDAEDDDEEDSFLTAEAKKKLRCKFRSSCYETGVVPEIKYVEPQYAASEEPVERELTIQEKCKWRKSCYETGELPNLKELIAIANAQAQQGSDGSVSEDEESSAYSEKNKAKQACKYKKSCYEPEVEAEAIQDQTADDATPQEDEDDDSQNTEDRSEDVDETTELNGDDDTTDGEDAPSEDTTDSQDPDEDSTDSNQAESDADAELDENDQTESAPDVGDDDAAGENNEEDPSEGDNTPDEAADGSDAKEPDASADGEEDDAPEDTETDATEPSETESQDEDTASDAAESEDDEEDEKDAEADMDAKTDDGGETPEAADTESEQAEDSVDDVSEDSETPQSDKDDESIVCNFPKDKFKHSCKAQYEKFLAKQAAASQASAPVPKPAVPPPRQGDCNFPKDRFRISCKELWEKLQAESPATESPQNAVRMDPTPYVPFDLSRCNPYRYRISCRPLLEAAMTSAEETEANASGEKDQKSNRKRKSSTGDEDAEEENESPSSAFDKIPGDQSIPDSTTTLNDSERCHKWKKSCRDSNPPPKSPKEPKGGGQPKLYCPKKKKPPPPPTKEKWRKSKATKDFDSESSTTKSLR